MSEFQCYVVLKDGEMTVHEKLSGKRVRVDGPAEQVSCLRSLLGMVQRARESDEFQIAKRLYDSNAKSVLIIRGTVLKRTKTEIIIKNDSQLSCTLKINMWNK